MKRLFITIFALAILAAPIFAQPAPATQADIDTVYMEMQAALNAVYADQDSMEIRISRLEKSLTTSGMDSAAASSLIGKILAGKRYLTLDEAIDYFYVDGSTKQGAALIARLGQRLDGKRWRHDIVNHAYRAAECMRVISDENSSAEERDAAQKELDAIKAERQKAARAKTLGFGDLN